MVSYERVVLFIFIPFSTFKRALKTLQFFAACLLSASSRGEGYYEKEAGGVEKAQDVNSNEVILNQKDGDATKRQSAQ